MGKCVLHRADGTSSNQPLGNVPVLIGRAGDAPIRVDDEFVSRKHCEVYLQDGKVVLRDLQSHNGTFVNGQRITEILLASGDKLQIGETRMVFQLSAQMLPPAVPGQPPVRDVDAIFRVTPSAPAAPMPSETVRIPFPQSPIIPPRS